MKPLGPAVRREQIYVLWDTLADFPVGETERALRHFMSTLRDWLGADDVLWIGGVRMQSGKAAAADPQLGWRGRAIEHLALTPEIARMSAQAMREQDTDPGMTTRAIVAGAGSFRVHRMRDGIVDMERFRRTPHYHAFYKDIGITDRMWAAFPLNTDLESYFLFDLYRTRRRFSEADVALVAETLRGLKWFHYNLMLSRGLQLAGAPLTPRQRQVLTLLLGNGSEKTIAHRLGLTPSTTHQYAVELYRKFGVKGRTGLMALWLGGAPPPTNQ